MAATEKRIGKIERITYGKGGYQEAQFGLSVTLSGPGWGVGSFDGSWFDPPSSHASWTTRDQDEVDLKTVKRIKELLSDAKVDSVDKLKGKPVEVIFDGNMLKSWRILTEAL